MDGNAKHDHRPQANNVSFAEDHLQGDPAVHDRGDDGRDLTMTLRAQQRALKNYVEAWFAQQELELDRLIGHNDVHKGSGHTTAEPASSTLPASSLTGSELQAEPPPLTLPASALTGTVLQAAACHTDDSPRSLPSELPTWLRPPAKAEMEQAIVVMTPELDKGTTKRSLSGVANKAAQVVFQFNHVQSSSEMSWGEKESELNWSRRPSRASTTRHEQNEQPFLVSLVQSVPMQYFMALVILGNAVAAGWEVQAMATSLHKSQAQGVYPKDGNNVPAGFRIAEVVFSCIFTLEVTARQWVLRKVFWQDWMWNAFDIAVAVASVLEVIITFTLGESHPILLFIRVVRVARIVGLIHIFKRFREAKMMLVAIFHTTRQLIWCLIIIFVVLYFFSVILTQATTQHLASLDEDFDYAHHMWEQWGTLPRTGYTLLKCMIEGDHWGHPAETLMYLNGAYFAIFLVFILVAKLTMLDVMLGFFSEHAFSIVSQDKEEMVAEQLRNKHQYINEFKRIFATIDADGSGTVTYDELEEHIKDLELQAYFASLNIDVEKAADIFHLLDDDGSGALSAEEFVDGCMRLRGVASTIDLAALSHDVRVLGQALRTFMATTLEELHKIGRRTSLLNMDQAIYALDHSLKAASGSTSSPLHTARLRARSPTMKSSPRSRTATSSSLE